MAIFKKIRKRVDRAIMKLLNKAKKAGRKLMQKLGIGAKEKPKNKEQHDEQVKAGLQYLDQQTTSVDKDNDKKLTQEEANKAATKTKSKFTVFKSITPKIKNGKWSFHWKASDGEFNSNKGVEVNEHNGENLKLKTKQSIDKLQTSIEKDETVNRDYKPAVDHLLERWKSNSGELKSVDNDQELMTIILQEYEDIIKEAESIQEKVNTRVPEENEREEIMKLYAKAEKNGPRAYMKHWKGNSEEQRKQSSLNGGPGQYLYSLSNEEVIKMEKNAI